MGQESLRWWYKADEKPNTPISVIVQSAKEMRCLPGQRLVLLIKVGGQAHLNDDTAAVAVGSTGILVNGDIVVNVDLVGEGIHECRWSLLMQWTNAVD